MGLLAIFELVFPRVVHAAGNENHSGDTHAAVPSQPNPMPLAPG